MHRSVYSIVLSDDVVREVDKLAYSLKTMPSALINQILRTMSPIPRPSSACGMFSRRWSGCFTVWIPSSFLISPRTA